MASIFYAWELGANFGHVGRFMPLARRLRDAGHAVHWAVSQPALVGGLLAQAGFTWLPAPATQEAQCKAPPLSYADILLRFGYADDRALFGLVGGWRELMRLTAARLVLADHAPTAMVAARTLGIPVMLFASGFAVPPRVSPTPNMRPWAAIPERVLMELDRAALASVNAVLSRYRTEPLPRLADMFDVAEDGLLTFPELDHYRNRGPARYWGSLGNTGTGAVVEWPPGERPRIFAYLRRECGHHETVLTALQAFDRPAVIYFPDLPNAGRKLFDSPRLRFLDHPADIAQVAREADLGINYAGPATATAFLLAGKPLLLLPTHLEQFLLARRVAEMGAGILIHPEQPPGDLCEPLAALAAQLGFKASARAFAEKYASFDQARVTSNLARRVEEILVQDRGAVA